MERKQKIIEKLKKNGCRITRQRLILIDVILENECSSCKEIYYKASQIDESIGIATVYRMINVLEEIGAISKKRSYSLNYEGSAKDSCIIVLDDETTYYLSPGKWRRVVWEGLKKCGYVKDQKLVSVEVQQPEKTGC